jgi:hypothetical protein
MDNNIQIVEIVDEPRLASGGGNFYDSMAKRNGRTAQAVLAVRRFGSLRRIGRCKPILCGGVL